MGESDSIEDPDPIADGSWATAPDDAVGAAEAVDVVGEGDAIEDPDPSTDGSWATAPDDAVREGDAIGQLALLPPSAARSTKLSRTSRRAPWGKRPRLISGFKLAAQS